RWLRYSTVTVSLGALLFCYSKLQTVDVASQASVSLGKWLAGQTNPSDVILQNRKRCTGPVEPVDVEFATNTRAVADRLLVPGVADVSDAARFSALANNGGSVLF